MGGATFAQAAAPGQPTLRTPRMTRDQFEHIKETYLPQLEQYFPNLTVSVLIEAPEKTDYGDIDFLISSHDPVDFYHLAQALGAAGLVIRGTGKHQRCSLAVPQNGSRSPHDVVVYHTVETKIAAPLALTVEAYAQIDIELVPAEDFDWQFFYCSYGDMGGLLGTIIRHLGFVVSDKGLILRLQELDDAKAFNLPQIADKDGMLWLSNDPDQIMRFLGLFHERYWLGFSTIEALFDWLAGCRMLSVDAVKHKRNLSRDRQKEAKRSLYSTFFGEYLPKRYGLVEEGEEEEEEEDKDAAQVLLEKDEAHATHALERADLCQQAVAFFSRETEYHKMRTALCLAASNLHAERLLKPIVAAHSGAKDKKLTELVRAFRRWTGVQNDELLVLKVPKLDAESQLHRLLKGSGEVEFKDAQVVSRFVKEHWEELKALERQRSKISREGATPGEA